MLAVTKVETGNSVLAQLAGTFDEITDLFGSLGIPGRPELQVKCGGVRRINSVGVKHWRHYFDELRSKGVKLKFHEVAPVLVEQMNYLPDFILPHEIESVCGGFYCSKCKLEAQQVYPISSLRQQNLAKLTADCRQCKAVLVLDDVPEIYFAFLSRFGAKK